MHVVFEFAPMASAVICGLGAFTALFAALIAFGQTDIKKVLAYSTVSQLGYMFIACGAGEYWAGMFHVTTHAFFKALLFLGAGAVIHAMSHDQDMRNYGKLFKYLKVTGTTMLIGTAAIAGVPFLSGAFSKGAILTSAFGSTHADIPGLRIGQIAGWVGLVTAGLTAWYMTRLTMLTFFGEKERWRDIPESAHSHGEHEEDGDHHALDSHHEPKEVPASMSGPLVILAALSLVGGFFLNKDDAFKHWLYPNGLPVLHQDLAGAEKLPVETIAIAAGALGIVLGVLMYLKGLPTSEGFDLSKWGPLRLAASNQFGYDELVSGGGVDGSRELALGTWQGLERWVVDGAVRGTSWLAEASGKALSLLQTGYVRFYALIFVGGVVCILGYLAAVGTQGVVR
jgi:NADH-quinone oxidoreductase subunit L